MKHLGRYIAAAGLAMVLVSGAPTAASAEDFNDEYVYASTRAVNRMNAHPGAKATLFPLTLVLDTAVLPFAVIAGFVTA